MCQLFYWLKFAIASILVINSARFTAAIRLFRSSRCVDWTRYTAAQYRLNARLKMQWTDTKDEFLDFLIDDVKIQKLMILLPKDTTIEEKKKHDESIKAVIDWKGLHPFSLRAHRWVPTLLDKKKLTLVIGSDAGQLRKIYKGCKHHCVVALMGGNYHDNQDDSDFTLRKSPSTQ